VNILVIDVGGTHVKMVATGHESKVKFASSPELTPQAMVKQVKAKTEGWRYEAVSIGYPGVVVHMRIAADPHNLGPGWLGFDFKAALGCDVRVVNDAAMQALGSYNGGRMERASGTCAPR